MDGEIDAEVFAKKQTELRDRMASLKLQMDALDRNREEMADLVLKVFELSQTLRNQWLTAEYAAKRRILEIVFLNCVLDDVTLVPTMRKLFDILAEGPLSEKSRGDCPSFEPWITALVETALAPTTEAHVAKQVVRISA